MRRGFIVSGVIWLVVMLLLAALTVYTAALPVLGVMALLILLPAGSVLYNLAARRGVSARLTVPSSTGKNKSAKCEVDVRRGKLPPLGRLFCGVSVTNDLTGESDMLYVPLAKNRGGYSGEFSMLTEHCGRLGVETQRIVLTDFFGMIPMGADVQTESRMTVMPETFPVELSPEMLSSPKDGEQTRDDMKGNDMTETFQLREYVAGDNLHGIHWKLSSKVGKLIFREPSMPVSNSLLLFFDQSSDSAEVLDALAESVFSVGQALCESGMPYMLGWSEQGELRFEEITNQDELIQNLPTLLRRNGATPPELSELADFGKVFYFTGIPPAEEPDGSIQVICCTQEGADMANAICFAPENCQEVMQRL
ncbi:MAG: DUF58 domain-containing protein [Oscillospiraceae bacterium]|nr:DUF58 domain-containing protein [Oscillospiraceae bacterium]